MMDIIKAQKEFIEAQQKFILALMKNQGIASSENNDNDGLNEEPFVFKGSIGENVRQLRKKANLTQNTLGEMVGIGHSMLCQIEKGTKIPSLGVALSIAKALGCTVDELCREESA